MPISTRWSSPNNRCERRSGKYRRAPGHESRAIGPRKATRGSFARAALLLTAVMIGGIAVAPSSSSAGPQRTPEPYRLTAIGRKSAAPPGAIVAVTAPAALLKNEEKYVVWAAGSTHTIAPRRQPVLTFGTRPINALGEVVGAETDGTSTFETTADMTRWSAQGSATAIGTTGRQGERNIGLLTDSGSALHMVEDWFIGTVATRFDRNGASTTVYRDDYPCQVEDMSETGVIVGSCYRHRALPRPLLAGTTMWPEAPPCGEWCDFQLFQVSPHATYVTGIYSDTDPEKPPLFMRGLWSLESGKLVAELPPGVVDVDDTGRVLIQNKSGFALWARGTTTPMADLVRLKKRETLLYPRFDADSAIVAIRSTAQGPTTIWQGVRLTARHKNSS